MIDYLIGALLLVVGTAFYAFVGAGIRKDTTYFGANLLVGYIGYSFLIAIVVIPMQLLGASFPLVVAGVVVVFLISVVASIRMWAVHGLARSLPSARVFLANNYFLIALALALFALFLLQTDLIWNNNHTDDGYYLLKIANLPHAADPYTTIHGTGYETIHQSLNSYHFSSHQSEMAVYTHIFRIDPVVFTRVFLNIFHYFLAAVTVCVFARELAKNAHLRIPASAYQYTASVLLIFSIEYRTIENWEILAAQDLWQFNGAMWYGGTLARVVAIMWLITPHLAARRINARMIAQVGVVSVVLLSMAAAAFPIIVVTALGYLFAFVATSGRWKIAGSALILGILGLAGLLLVDKPHMSELMSEMFARNLTSVALWASVALVVIALAVFRTLELTRFAIILVFGFALMIIPELNDVFEHVAMIDFVARRAQTAGFYMLIIGGFVSLALLIAKFVRKLYVGIQLILATLLGLASVASTVPVYGNPFTTLAVMRESPHIMPNETVELSHYLQGLSGGEDLDVIVPEWVEVKHRRHYVATIIRAYAPHVRSVSAIPRFGAGTNPDFAPYSLTDQSAYDTFIRFPTHEHFERLAGVLEAFPIDVVAIPGDQLEPYVDMTDFELIDHVGRYWIYQRQ